MAVVVKNESTPADNSSSNMSSLLIALFFIFFVYLFFVYGIPALRNAGGVSPQINIPNKVDLNINQKKQ